jgi:FkbM family methyltransferase
MLPPGRRANILEILVREMVSTVRIGNDGISMYTPFPNLIWRADSLLTKETDTIRWIDGFDVGSVFWDIGANVGVYSLYAALKRHALVVAFEPTAANFYALTQNTHLNRLDSRIATYCLALSDVTRFGNVNLSSAEMGTAVHQFGDAGERSPYAGGTPPQAMHGAVGFSVDDLVEQFLPPFPNHIKIDVDGLELKILSGAFRTLRDPRLRSVLVELSITYNEREQAAAILDQAGFKIVSQGSTQSAGGNKAANCLFWKISPEGN